MIIRHTGIVVKNLKKEIKFYEKFGLKILKEDLEKGEFISTILGNEVEVKTCKLTEQIELLQYIKGHGENHIAFTIDNEDDFKKLKLISKPQISPDGKVKVAFGYDPEHNLIELVYEIPRSNIQRQAEDAIPFPTMSTYKTTVGLGNWC